MSQGICANAHVTFAISIVDLQKVCQSIKKVMIVLYGEIAPKMHMMMVMMSDLAINLIRRRNVFSANDAKFIYL